MDPGTVRRDDTGATVEVTLDGDSKPHVAVRPRGAFFCGGWEAAA
jgi:hypothetical protein